MSSTNETLQTLNEFKNKLDKLEIILDQIFSKPLDETLATMNDLEKIKFKTTLAHTIQTLYICYLKTNGQDLENKKYLDRIRIYFTKIDELEK